MVPNLVILVVIWRQQSESKQQQADYRVLDLNPPYETNTGVSDERIRGRSSRDACGTAAPRTLAEYALTART